MGHHYTDSWSDAKWEREAARDRAIQAAHDAGYRSTGIEYFGNALWLCPTGCAVEFKMISVHIEWHASLLTYGQKQTSND